MLSNIFKNNNKTQDMRSTQIIFFSYFPKKTYIAGTNRKRETGKEERQGRKRNMNESEETGKTQHLYQVPPKYSERYSSYRADTKSISIKTKGNNFKSKKGRVVILVHDASSCPVLHFYQVSLKYSKGCSNYRADTKLIHNHCQI